MREAMRFLCPRSCHQHLSTEKFNITILFSGIRYVMCDLLISLKTSYVYLKMDLWKLQHRASD